MKHTVATDETTEYHTDKDSLLRTQIDCRNVQQREPCIRTRFVIAVTSFVGLGIILGQRASFSVALVAMVNFTNIDDQNTTTADQCPEIEGHVNSSTIKLKEGDFNWDGETQSNLLASFFYGYVCLQIIGGYVGERYSLKLMIGLCVLFPSIVNLFIPMLARWSVSGLLVARVLTGLITGPIFPCNAAVWGRWAPLMERSTLATATALGGSAGIVVITPLAGILCDSSFLGGWPSVFYIFGVCGCAWFLVWMYVMYDSPADHPRISAQERIYIESSLKSSAQEKYTSLPWKSLLTSLPVWVMNFAYLCNGLCFYVVFSCFPLYLREVLKFDVAMNSIILSLIYLASIFFGIISGYTADLLRRKTRLSITAIRKILTVTGNLAGALGCVGVALVSCSRVWAVVFIVAGIGLAGLAQGGYGVNPIDLAPQYSGTIMGMANAVGNAGGFISPLFVNLITQGTANKDDWQIVFFMTSGIFALSAIVYLFFSNSEEQPWAKHAQSISVKPINAEGEDQPSEPIY